jgi:hypothetical protein
VVKAWGTWRGNEWENKGEVVEVGVWGREGKVVEVKAVGVKEYLIERTGCECDPCGDRRDEANDALQFRRCRSSRTR